MKTIKTITCHDVYNVGASLQAFALITYLNEHGYNAEIIDYKPEYLSRHYRLNIVSNPSYDKPFIRELYLLAKLPARLLARRGEKKKEFDAFRNQYLKVTAQKFQTNEELCRLCPKADAYIAGSDQIWNPLFPNGRDPSFFLNFVSDGNKISYAASFAVETIPEELKTVMQKHLRTFDAISVREKSGVQILEDLGLQGEQVCDPVFLLPCKDWETILSDRNKLEKYIYVYDFDNSDLISKLVKEISAEEKLGVLSYFKRSDAVRWKESGPLSFLRSIADAEIVISNSFHATAFSLIFHKDFFVVGRKESINTRMRDLLDSLDLSDRYLCCAEDWKTAKVIDWNSVDQKLKDQIQASEDFLKKALEN